MTVPLWILAFGSVFAGFLPFSHLVTTDGIPFESHIHWGIATASIVIALIGILLAAVLYLKESTRSSRIASSLGALYAITMDKFYVDEVYMYITKNIIFKYISAPIAWFDRNIVDGLMNLFGNVTVAISFRIRKFQSGNIHQYAFVFLAGVLIAALLFMFYYPI